MFLDCAAVSFLKHSVHVVSRPLVVFLFVCVLCMRLNSFELLKVHFIACSLCPLLKHFFFSKCSLFNQTSQQISFSKDDIFPLITCKDP